MNWKITQIAGLFRILYQNRVNLIIQIETLSTTSYLMMFPNFGVSYLEWMEWVASILNIYILKCYIELVNI